MGTVFWVKSKWSVDRKPRKMLGICPFSKPPWGRCTVPCPQWYIKADNNIAHAHDCFVLVPVFPVLAMSWSKVGTTPDSGSLPCPHRGDVDLSAVCEYQLEEIQRVFEGPYKEYREQAQKWGRYTDPVPSPRPGSVSPPEQGWAPALSRSTIPTC